MTQMPDLDRQLTAWLESAGPADPPAGLVDEALAGARRTRRRSALAALVLGPAPWPPAVPRSRYPDWAPGLRLALLVALALAAVVGAVAVGSQLLTPPRLSEIAPTEAPSVSPAPTATVGEVVNGWPSTGRNPAGLYAWGDPRCAGQYCVRGFMHNGYGSGDVQITIRPAVRPLSDDGEATPVTVAGHQGTYRRVDDRKERWVVDIMGTLLVIVLEANTGTSPSDLAEAHAIIESMRTEPQDNRRGFRLVFALPTNDWDSG